jgi:hypothetical protein
MIRYPIEMKNEAYEAALGRLQVSAYASEDQPHLFTERYSLSSDYEKADVDAKAIVNVVGAADNLYWLNYWKQAAA